MKRYNKNKTYEVRNIKISYYLNTFSHSLTKETNKKSLVPLHMKMLSQLIRRSFIHLIHRRQFYTCALTLNGSINNKPRSKKERNTNLDECQSV